MHSEQAGTTGWCGNACQAANTIPHSLSAVVLTMHAIKTCKKHDSQSALTVLEMPELMPGPNPAYTHCEDHNLTEVRTFSAAHSVA